MQVVCERELTVKEQSGIEGALVLKIYAPSEDMKDGGDWACAFSITGGGIDISQTMYGVDSLQALLHGLMAAEAHLIHLKRTLALEITWLGMEDLGFSTSV